MRGVIETMKQDPKVENEKELNETLRTLAKLFILAELEERKE